MSLYLMQSSSALSPSCLRLLLLGTASTVERRDDISPKAEDLSSGEAPATSHPETTLLRHWTMQT